MFNVAVLKMKDILKYLVGIVITILLVIFVSKGLKKDGKEKDNIIIRKLETGINLFADNSMLFALDEAMPVVANVNEEYKNIAEEDVENKESKNILKAMLGMQISSIKEIENMENNEIKKEENEKENNQTEKNQEEQKIESAGTPTEVITPNPISDGSNTKIRKCKNKK